MEISQSNILSTITFDGVMLRYRLNGLAGRLLELLGYSMSMEIPVNTVLEYEFRLSWTCFHRVRLATYSHSYGRSKEVSSKVRTIILFGTHSDKTLKSIEEVLQRNLKETMQGENVGLSTMPMESVLDYYKFPRLKRA